jgi:hypothetical protein
MSLFWDKKIEQDKIIYTRTKRQKRIFIFLMLGGFLLSIGTATLIRNSAYFGELSQKWPIPFLFIIVLGFLIIILSIILGGYLGFRLTLASLQHKKFQTMSNSDNLDTIIIEK